MEKANTINNNKMLKFHRNKTGIVFGIRSLSVPIFSYTEIVHIKYRIKLFYHVLASCTPYPAHNYFHHFVFHKDRVQLCDEICASFIFAHNLLMILKKKHQKKSHYNMLASLMCLTRFYWQEMNLKTESNKNVSSLRQYKIIFEWIEFDPF